MGAFSAVHDWMWNRRMTDRAAATPTLHSLTGLRWVAAFVVFGYHVMNMGYFSGIAQDLMGHVFGAGATGVSLFFVLSGFVLVWSHKAGVSAPLFWRRRLARIYPLHVVTLVIALIVAATLVPWIRTTDPSAIVANLLLVSAWYTPWNQAGNPVSWTLVCEAFFYLMFPLIMLVLPRLNRLLLGVGAVALIALVFVTPFVVAQFPFLSANSWPVARIPEFMIGMVLAQLMRSGIWRGPGILVSTIVLVAGYILVLANPYSPLTLAGFTIIGFAMIVAALARADIEGRRTVLATRPLVFLGTVSFAFYLVHLLTLQSIKSFWPGPPSLPVLPALALTLLAFAVGLGVAWALHVIVEKPGRRLILAPSQALRPSRA